MNSLLTAEQYHKALLRDILAAKKRIVIHAMVLLWGGRTEQLLPLLEAALERNVEVRLVGDIYSKYEAKTARIAKRGPYLDWKKTTAINQQLTAAGAHVTYIGKLDINPFRGRCHSKITIIDDTAYTFGGVNFSNSHFSYQDQMVEMHDARMAGRLYTLVREIEKDGQMQNVTERIDERTTLLFDGGIPGKSVIYDTACEMVAGARKVYFVSKMCPSGKLAQLLKKTDYRCYFNRPSLEGIPENMAIMFDQLSTGIRNSYSGSKLVHAKVILCENADGSRYLLTGSNNFSWRGIAFGTKEIAVHSTDPDLWQQFYVFLQENIAT